MSTCYNIFGDAMSYKIDKFFHINLTDDPSTQYISTTYTELTGSKCEIKSINPSPDLVYKYTFHAWPDKSASPAIYNFHLNIKLQKSNDNFSSNIVDVTGHNFSISGDTYVTSDRYMKTIHCFFIVEDFDSSHLRVVARSFSTTTKAQLHRNNSFDCSTNLDLKTHPNLIVAEV